MSDLVFHGVAAALSFWSVSPLRACHPRRAGGALRAGDIFGSEGLDDVGRPTEYHGDQKPDSDEVPKTIEREVEEIHKHG